jgi:hypothetical protein
MSKLKVCPVCPMCKSPHDREVDPGSKVTCPDCDEVYHAEAPEPSEKVARPMERSPGKRAAPAADTDDDSKPKARAKPAAKKPATARRSRSEREPANAGGGQVLVLLAAGIGGLVLLAAVGGGFLMWALSGKKDDKREVAQQVAPAPDVPVPVPQPQPPQPQPVVQKDDPDLGPRPGVKRPAPQTAAPVPSPSPRSKRRTEPPVPVGPPPEPPGPDVPSFAEPANPFKPGTQTKLRQVRAVKLPAPPAPKDMTGRFAAPEPAQLAHSPKHDLLFVRRSDMVWAYDLKADNELGGRRAKEQFTDLSLSPDEAAAFAADYGQEHTGYGTPVNPHWIHRFDMATREWESRKAPKVAWRMEAVDAHRVLLGERDQWIAVSLNRWETDGVGIRELARIGADRSSDFEYNPRTGQVYYANGTLLQVRGDKLVQAPRPASPAGQRAAWGATAVLSRDGTKLYSGAVQVDAADPTNVLEKFPEPILAASRDIAFGAKAYYRATSGSTLGEYPFPAEKKADRSDPYGTVTRTAVHVSPDGLSVWVLDPAKNAAVQFAIEGEK